MQDTIDAKADIAQITARLDVDITGTLLECILQQPVHNTDDVLVIGVRFGLAAELHHGLEIGQFAALAPRQRPGTLHGACHGIKFFRVPGNIPGIRQNPPHRQSCHVLQVFFPERNPGLGTRHGHRLLIDSNGQDLMALSESLRHHLGNRTGVNFQWVNIHH